MVWEINSGALVANAPIYSSLMKVSSLPREKKSFPLAENVPSLPLKVVERASFDDIPK